MSSVYVGCVCRFEMGELRVGGGVERKGLQRGVDESGLTKAALTKAALRKRGVVEERGV